MSDILCLLCAHVYVSTFCAVSQALDKPWCDANVVQPIYLYVEDFCRIKKHYFSHRLFLSFSIRRCLRFVLSWLVYFLGCLLLLMMWCDITCHFSWWLSLALSPSHFSCVYTIPIKGDKWYKTFFIKVTIKESGEFSCPERKLHSDRPSFPIEKDPFHKRRKTTRDQKEEGHTTTDF